MFPDAVVVIPPKSIWDPSDGHDLDDDEEDDDDYTMASSSTLNTKSTSHPKHSNHHRRRRKKKHPSQMDEVELRVQLWDSYRLARIILGIPIKSFQLKSKTILHAIRIVAEMKLELIRLHKEVQVTKLQHEMQGIDESYSNIEKEQDWIFEKEQLQLTLTQEQTASKLWQDQHVDLVESTRNQLQRLVLVFNCKDQEWDASANDNDNDPQQGLEIQQLLQTLLQTVEDTSQQTQLKLQVLQDKVEPRAKSGEQTQTQTHLDIETTTATSTSPKHQNQLQSTPKSSNNNNSNSNSNSKPEQLLNQHHRQPSNLQLETMQRKYRTSQTLSQLELETSKQKHLQQVVDMSGQLESYKEQVSRQLEECLKWKQKYTELEKLAVTPTRAKQVLEQLQTITQDSTIQDQQQIQVDIVDVLQRLTQLHLEQDRERNQLQSTLSNAQSKEKISKEQLDSLTLQDEILQDEIQNQPTPEEYHLQMAHQRLHYRRKISNILSAEEHRLTELEYLEVRLTELAFLAVELEDFAKESKENQQRQERQLQSQDKRQKSAQQQFQNVQHQVQELLSQQQQTLKQLTVTVKQSNSNNQDTSPSLHPEQEEQDDSSHDGSEDHHHLQVKLDKLVKSQTLQQTLAQRDEELRHARKQLLHSQMRIQQLEAQVVLVGQGLKVENGGNNNAPLSLRRSDTESTVPMSN